MIPQIVREFLTSPEYISHQLQNLYEITKRETYPPGTKKVVLITGPSGAGKDTLVNSLPQEKYVRWRTWTTRAEVRNDEVEIDPYVRVSREEFEEEIKKGHFMEYNEYAGNLYGTHKREAEEAFEDGRIPVLRIDPRGALKFNQFSANKEHIFGYSTLNHYYIIPPTFDELIRRLRTREQDEKVIQRRIEAAKSDLPYVVNAHYLIVSNPGEVLEAVEAVNYSLEF